VSEEPTPRYYIDSNEQWPVYSPRQIPPRKKGRAAQRYEIGVEIPDEFIVRYDKAVEEWNAVQAKLGEYEEEQEKRFEAYREEHGCKKLREGNGLFGWSTPQRCYAFPKSDGTCPYEEEHVE
jgi:hypothetical protein